jgi:hypothetical protein
MVRKFAFLALFLILGTVFVSSCKKEELSSKKEILAFSFDKTKNPQLERFYAGEIDQTNITIEIAFGVPISQLIPTIEISPRATISPSSDLSTDFTGPVVYTITAEDGTTKTFTVTVTNAAAPYIGEWSGGPIDFGLGIMRVNAVMTADGNIIIEFVKIMTGEKDANSFKGTFEPISRQDSDIRIEQTHRWINNDWIGESCCRTIMYHVITPTSMKLFYCMCNPRVNWWFEVILNKT